MVDGVGAAGKYRDAVLFAGAADGAQPYLMVVEAGHGVCLRVDLRDDVVVGGVP